MVVAALLTALSTAQAQDVPPGAVVSDAIVANVTQEGLDQLGGLVSGFLPVDGIVLDPVNLSGGGGFCLFEYALDVTNVRVELEILDTQVTPVPPMGGQPGQLVVAIDALININDPIDQFTLSYDALCLDGDCPSYVDPFPVTIELPIGLEIDPTTGLLDAQLGQTMLSNGLVDDNINLDCSIQTIQDILDLIGISLYDFIIGFAEDFLVDEIDNQAAEIELLVEDAFASATINESIDLLGSQLDIYLAPRDIVIDTTGLQLVLEGSADAPAAACVADLDPGASAGTPGPAPALASEPPGTQAAVHLSDDFVNSALYAVWRSGVLCQELAEGEFGGFSIDTALLGLLGGEPYRELFPETAPMILKTVPNVPLEARFDGPHDVDVPIQDLEVLFFAELDGRMARALGVGISPNVGVDLVFDDTVGNLTADVQLGDDFQTRLTGDVMVPGAEEEVVSNVDGFLVTIVDTLLGSLLGENLSFAVPALSDGYGLTSLEAQGTGGGEWLGVYAELGPITYTSAGCEDGCSGGSSCSSSPASLGFWALLALFVRRRR